MTIPPVRDDVTKKFTPFMEEVLGGYKENIHSIYITGSALTEDFDPKTSDINSVIVLKKMDLTFLEHLAPLGKKYNKHKVSAPLIMTPKYIEESLDVFPIEFLNIQLLHHAVYGEDIFSDLKIKRQDLRHQCEREIKVRLIGLRQGYLASMGDRRLLTDTFVNTISGYIPLFRGIILLLGHETPIGNDAALSELAKATGVNTDVFVSVLKEKKQRVKLTIEQLNTIFEDYYSALEKLGGIVDGIQD